MSLEELNPRISNKLGEFCRELKEIDQLSAILNTIDENKHLFDKFEHEISITFRGEKVI